MELRRLPHFSNKEIKLLTVGVEKRAKLYHFGLRNYRKTFCEFGNWVTVRLMLNDWNSRPWSLGKLGLAR